MTQPLRFGLLLALGAAFGVGCNKDETAIRTYSAPKDIPAPQVASADVTAASAVDSAQSGSSSPLSWTLPDGWKQVPPADSLEYAAFQIAPNDPKARLTVVPLRSPAVLANIKRWAGQLKLPEVSEADLPKYTTPIQVAGEDALRVDMTGSPESGKPPVRLFAIIVARDDGAWTFTLKAPEPVALAQQPNFDRFVQSIRFQADSSADPSPTAPADAGSRPSAEPPFKLTKWTTPAGWEQEPATNAMRVVSFRLGAGDESAEVIVSRITRGSFGSIPDNMNRWRDEVGLDRTEKPEPDNVEQLQMGGHEALLLSFDGPVKQSLIVMHQEGADFFFIKMLGAKSLVLAQQDVFKRFLDSLQFEPESH